MEFHGIMQKEFHGVFSDIFHLTFHIAGKNSMHTKFHLEDGIGWNSIEVLIEFQGERNGIPWKFIFEMEFRMGVDGKLCKRWIAGHKLTTIAHGLLL